MIISKKKYIGILGGTFDPPHAGHFFISKFALIRLGLDEIWWVVTLRNPLKKTHSDFSSRQKKAEFFPKSRTIKVIRIKEENKTIYTVDILDHLKQRFPKVKFIWLMGVDGLENFHLWKNWRKIFCNIPIAIFDRPFYSLNISKSRVIGFFKNKRIKTKLSDKLKFMPPPVWVFLNGLTNPESSTKKRLEIDEKGN